MRREDYDLMHALESDYWWFVGMREVTGALLRRWTGASPRDFLDVGCGTGINLLWIVRNFAPRRTVGCDYSPLALGWCAEKLAASGPDSRQISLARGDVRSLPFASDSFDLLTILDVLDQFPPDREDVRGLAELHRVLRPGGFAFVREPAYRWLLSSHDELFETRHRYTTAELAKKMRGVGFEIVATSYANTILFPAALAQRLLRKIAGFHGDRTDTQPWPRALAWLNVPFSRCLGLEAAWLGRGGRLPFGLSAICIGRK